MAVEPPRGSYAIKYVGGVEKYLREHGKPCTPLERGEEQNREEGEMAQKKLGGGRNRGKK